MAQLVEVAQVLLPFVVDDVQEYRFLERLDNLLALRLVGSLEVARYVVDTPSVGDGNQDVLIHLSLVLIHLLDHRIGNLRNPVAAAFELCHCRIERLVCQCLLAVFAEVLFRERSLHGEDAQDLHLAVVVVCQVYGIHGTFPNHVGDVHSDAFAHQRVAAFLVDHRALLVHHVIIFQQVLADAEVVLLDLLLCAFYRLRNHLVLNHLALLEAQAVHHFRYALAREQTHQVVFERHEEHRRTRVALTAGASAQLAVHTA